ncbi:MAG: TadE/TadG family type IV pilus assembly protein [Alsobacter sp.]
MTSVLRNSLAALMRDSRGSFAPLFAVLAIPIAMAIAIGIDYNNTVRLRQKLQNAVDTAVLAAARLNDADDTRLAAAQRYFDAQVDTDLKAQIVDAQFTMDSKATNITGTVKANIRSFMPHALSKDALEVNVKAVSAVAKPINRQLDVVMCIDGTGSMSATITAVKNNALNFESNLNAELVKRNIPAFDAMRVRVVFYRDYGGYYLSGATTNTTVCSNGSCSTKQIKSTDPNYWSYVGDLPPIRESGWFPLPAQRTNFSTFVNPETAWGGGDLPESGLECVNNAISSSWAKIGDIPAGGTKPIDAIYPLIVVWTDAAAHKPSYSVSIKNPSYPASTVMPRNYTDLLAKWNSGSNIDQLRKMLVFFGNPDLNSTDRDGTADGWKQLKLWPGFYLGGTLSGGNSQMVSKIADVLATKVLSPTLVN